MQAPTVVTKEVPIEVIKEVEKPLPEIYKTALETYLKFSGAKFAANEGSVLEGVKSLRVFVEVGEAVKNDISSSTIKNKIELELRKLGVRIDDNSDVSLSYNLWVLRQNDSEILGFSESLAVRQMVTLPRETGYIKNMATIWENRSYGTVGKENVKQLADNYDDKLSAFLNAYLAANPRAAN